MARLRDATAGEYDILGQVGRGGMAAVYLARDCVLARHVAVKVMFPELALHDGMARRFEREARLAARLDDHPNVVRVYRARDVAGLRFFVMKYIDGCTLDQVLRAAGPLSIGVTCHVLDQVARTLQYAHGRGVVHRDVKPSNVMLDRRGVPIVADFGIARSISQTADGAPLTQVGVVLGTPAYMSPEQWRAEESTPASDQYALGAVAYQMLAGAPPHTGTPFEMREGHLHHAPVPLRRHRPDCSPALASMVHRMLAKTPSARWPDLDPLHTTLSGIPRPAASELAVELGALVLSGMLAGGVDVATPRSPILPAPGSPPRATLTGADVSSPSEAASARAPALARTACVRAPGVHTPSAGRPAEPLRAEPPRVEHSTAPTVILDQGRAPEQADDPTQCPGGAVGANTAAQRAAPSRRRRAPVRAAGGLAAGLVTTGVIAMGARSTSWPPRELITRDPGTPVVRPAPASRQPPVTDTRVAPVEPVDGRRTDSAGAAGAAGAARGRADAGVVGPPARMHLIVVAPSRRLALGDSALVDATVFDARGRRVRSVQVQWSSSDTTRVAWRTHGGVHYAVARAAGRGATVTARSGAIARAVTFTVRAARVVKPPAVLAVTPATTAAAVASAVPVHAVPSDETLNTLLVAFLGHLRGRNVDAMPRFGSAEGDASAQAFLAWLGKAKGMRLESVTHHPAVWEGRNAASARLDVRLSWRTSRFHREKPTAAARFRLTIVRDGDGWRVDHAQLLHAYPPR